ncbi:unnamed protein product [Paramecium pentaurelia]|uniref:Uncharacterized protein n=1 Tax=Paramecium pentaurelia TaxID=43138 RepID=A0A8S1XB64_9CILI|nr:unnamed protein product [Paramecium pentaurelia]
MTLLIVTSIVFMRVVCQQVILFASSFSDKKLVNLENWTLYPKNLLQTGFGSLSVDDDDYAGLYSMNGAQYKSYLAGMYKIYESIPAHSTLIIKAKTLMQNFGFGGTGTCRVRADGILIIQIANNLDLINNYKINSFSVPYQSSSSAVLIEFHFEAIGDYQSLTFGFREFELYYKTCPPGCTFCQTSELQSNDCNFWSLDQRQLFDQGSLNEGWTINFKDKKQYRTDYCQDDKALNLIGFALPTESIERTLYLQPHYKMLILYKLLLLGADSIVFSYFYFELNDVIVNDIKFATYLKTSQICKHTNPSSMGDYIQQVKYEDFNQNTILKLRIFTQGRTYFQKLKWTIRDLEIFIKKCHPDCTESCFGPRANQCSRQKYPKFENFVSYFIEPLFTDTQEWQMITPIQPKSPNYCSGISIFGGYLQLGGDHYIQRFITLEDHQTIQISFKFYQIDNFNNDILYVVVDDQIVYQTVLEPIIDTSKATLLCGIYENYDLIVKISTPIIQHTQKQKILSLNKIQQYIYKNQNKLDF